MADVKCLKRKFKYGSLEIEDPGAEMSVEEVKNFYASVYPELTQAVIEGPEYETDSEAYTFVKAVGTKGQLKLQGSITIGDVARGTLSSVLGASPATKLRKKGGREKCLDGNIKNHLLNLQRSSRFGGVILIPGSSALPLLP